MKVKHCELCNKEIEITDEQELYYIEQDLIPCVCDSCMQKCSEMFSKEKNYDLLHMDNEETLKYLQ